jgi:hypothetical protein
VELIEFAFVFEEGTIEGCCAACFFRSSNTAAALSFPYGRCRRVERNAGFGRDSGVGAFARG